MKRAAAVIVVAVLAVGCSSDPPEAVVSEVEQRIVTSTDCAGLQREFDVAMENAEKMRQGTRDVPLHYAELAADRMVALGCP